MANPPLQIEDANYVNNRSYTLRPYNNLPSHYNNQAIVPHEPYQLINTMAAPGFQNQGALSSNYQRNTRQPKFNELLLMINDMKKSTDTRITQLEHGQVVMGNVMKNMESIQSTMGTCMKNMEHNQENIGTCMKNMETNQVELGASLKNLETQMG